MAVMVQVEVEVKVDQLGHLKTMLKQGFPATREFDGCDDLTAYLSDDGKTLVVVEFWKSREHYQKYYAWREETGVLAQLSSCIQGSPTIRYFDAIDA